MVFGRPALAGIKSQRLLVGEKSVKADRKEGEISLFKKGGLKGRLARREWGGRKKEWGQMSSPVT